MKHIHFLSILLFISASCAAMSPIIEPTTISDDRDTIGRSFFNPRSQGSNTVRDSVGIPRVFIQDNPCCLNGIFVVTPGYAASFDRSSIGKYLFFNGSDVMVTGTAAGPNIDIFSENFLLNDNFASAVQAKPSVKNGFADFAIWANLDRVWCGLYFFAHAPIVHTSWDVDLTETVTATGTFIGANALGNTIATAAPADNMITAWKGQTTFFDVKSPMQFARIDGKKSKTTFADVELAFGWAFINNPCSYLSVNIRTIIPTGTRPDGVYLFEPIVGNGRHWEFGGGVLGNLELWNNCCDQSLSIFLNGSIYTMFSARQRRTFDLTKNGIGSRYLLFKKFNGNTYANEIVRGPNILTLDVDTKNIVHGDMTIMLDYIFGGWDLNIGYNLWGRSRDEIKLKGEIPENTYGIAGLSGTGANANTTASQTTISGANASTLDASPVFISNADLNITSAQTPGTFSHSVFAYLGYYWGCEPQPFIGIGTQFEFSGTGNRALRMWHVFAKAGLSLF